MNVYELLLIKPENYKGLGNILGESVDQMMFEFSLKKSTENLKFINSLREVSIENMDC